MECNKLLILPSDTLTELLRYIFQMFLYYMCLILRTMRITMASAQRARQRWSRAELGGVAQPRLQATVAPGRGRCFHLLGSYLKGSLYLPTQIKGSPTTHYFTTNICD